MKRKAENSGAMPCLFGLNEFVVGPDGCCCECCGLAISGGSTALRLGENVYCGVTCADRHQSDLDSEAGLERGLSTMADKQPVLIFENREGLRAELRKLLHRNRAIFETYGPGPSHDPLSDAAEMWSLKVVQDVIPNNQRILDLLAANDGLLTQEERVMVERFRIHKEGFEYNHTSGDKNSSVPLFPREMDGLLS